MTAALRAEYRKLVTTSLWWWLLLVMAAYLAFIGLVMAFSLTVDNPEAAGSPVLTGSAAAVTVYSLVSSIGYVFPLVIGSLTITGEFRHQTITQSLLVEPRRGVLLGAKLLATVPIGLLYGVVGVAALVAAGAPVLAWQGDGAYLTQRDTVEVLVLGVVVMALWTVIGVAFGSVVPNQVAAIVVILAFTQFVEPIARIALGSVDALSGVAAYLPGSAADGLIGASLFNEMGSGDLLPRWAALLVLLGYAGVLALVGRWTTLRRDVG